MKKTKEQLYYEGLQKTVEQAMSENTDIAEVKERMDNYVANQTYLKRLNKDHKSLELLYYIAGETLIAKSLQTIVDKYRKENRLIMDRKGLQEYIYSKMQGWTYSTFVLPAPEVTIMKLLRNQNKRISAVYESMT